MKVTSAAPAAPGFDAPLELLAACHDRILQLCALLDALPQHLARAGADADARQAARRLIAYFDTAAAHHHDDEERNLFPLLEAAGAPGACDLVETLTLEHEEAAWLWRRLRTQLIGLTADEAGRLDKGLVHRFTALERSHVTFENAHLLPLAARCLDAAARLRLGAAMAARRGVRLPGGSP